MAQSGGLSEFPLLKFQQEIKSILSSDDEHKFLSLFTSPLVDYNYKFQLCSSTVLGWACSLNAVKCANALLERKTRLLIPDVNFRVLGHYCPLHFAARNLSPCLVESLLRHGARTDIRCDDGDPLRVALRASSNHEYLKGWTSGESSIFKLIATLCLPKMREVLETNKLLAQHLALSSPTDIAFMAHSYGLSGRLTEVAILLMVARKSVTVPMSLSTRPGSWTISQCLNCSIGKLIDDGYKLMKKVDDEKQIDELKMCMMLLRSRRLLHDVFERAGDDIEEYLLTLRPNVLVERVAKDVGTMLYEAGFDLKPQDCDLEEIIRKPTKTALVQSECGTQPFQLQLPLRQSKVFSPNTVPCMPRRLPHGAQSVLFAKRLVHTNQISPFPSHYTRIVDAQVKEGTKAIEQRLPKLMSSVKLAFSAFTIKRRLKLN